MALQTSSPSVSTRTRAVARRRSVSAKTNARSNPAQAVGRRANQAKQPATSTVGRIEERLVANDGDAFHRSHCGRIVGDRIVLTGTVVPERDGILAPAETDLVLGNGRLGVEVVEQPVAFLLAEPLDRPCEGAIDVERPFPGFGMGPHHGMLLQRKPFIPLVNRDAEIACEAASVVDGGQSADPILHGGRKAFVRRDHIRPHGIAAHFGDDPAAQHRTQ